MPGHLEQLGNEQALLMYLSGELAPQDRQELEQMLASDPRLKGELQSLRGIQQEVFASMAVLDRIEPLPVAEQTAVRGVRRQLNLRNLVVSHEPSHIAAARKQKRLAYPWWSYPMATAAAIVLAFLVWWGNSSYSPRNYEQSASTAYDMQTPPLDGRGWNPGPRQFSPEMREAYMQLRQQHLAQWLEASLSGDDAAAASGDRPLDNAESQLASLTEPNHGQFPFAAALETNQ